ncbi:terminase small subunit [Campylobacterota bacterium]
MNSQLTKKQQDFCEEFVVSRSVSQAAYTAGFSANYAKKKAYKLLQDERIISKIDELDKAYTTNRVRGIQRKALEKLDEVLDQGRTAEKLKAIEQVFRISGLAKGLEVEAQNNDSIIRVRLPDGM